jgi:hypothetical protein
MNTATSETAAAAQMTQAAMALAPAAFSASPGRLGKPAPMTMLRRIAAPASPKVSAQDCVSRR